MSKVLIIGGAGYIGSSLAERLIQDGHRVTIYDSLYHNQDSVQRLDHMLVNGISVSDALLQNFNGSMRPRDFRFMQADIRDINSLKRIFAEEKFDYVFHLGELVGHECCIRDTQAAESVNVAGTKNVVDLALEHQVALIWNSTSSVYGFRDNPGLLDETAVLPPADRLDEYSRRKLPGEEYIAHNADKNSDFRAIVLRPATVGGLSPRMRLELLPNHFTYSMMIGHLSLTDANYYRAVIDINDLVDAYAAILNSGVWHNGVFNIGNYNMTKNQFADEISKALEYDDSRVSTSGGEKFRGDGRNLQISSAKFTQAFGFQPRRTLSGTVKSLVEILRRHPALFSSNGYRGSLNIPIKSFEEMCGIRN